MTATLSPVTLPASAADTDVVRALREVLAQRTSAATAAYYQALGELQTSEERQQALTQLAAAGVRLTEAEETLAAFDRVAREL